MTDDLNTTLAHAGTHWYQVVQGDALRQGDLVTGMPVFHIAADYTLPSIQDIERNPSPAVPGTFAAADWVILSPSCDIDTGRARQLLLAQCVPATKENTRSNSEKEHLQRLEVVRQGLDPAKFLLPPHSGEPSFQLAFVNIRSIALLPVAVVKSFAGQRKRLRLQHPFRERFGNWAGQWISNVGPENSGVIPRITKIFEKHILESESS